MSRRIDLNGNLTLALSPVLIPELISLVQSYATLPNVLFVIGGLQSPFAEPLASVEMITVLPSDAGSGGVRLNGSIVQSYELATGVQGMGCTVLNDTIYVCGGFDAGLKFLKSVRAINPFSNGERRWIDCPPLIRPLNGAAMVAVGTVLYAFGGWNGSELMSADVWRFDTATLAAPAGDKSVGWSLLPRKSPQQKQDCNACLAPDGYTIFVAGDRGAHGTDVEVFDARTETFGALMPVPVKSPKCAALCVFRGDLWLIGGYHSGFDMVEVRRTPYTTNGSNDNSRSVVWTSDAPLQSARSFARACVVDDTMLVIGGQQRGSETRRSGMDSIESYDPVKRRWSEHTLRLSTGRYNFALAHCH